LPAGADNQKSRQVMMKRSDAIKIIRTMHGLVAVMLSWAFLSVAAWAETPARIISLAPNVTEILYDFGLGANVIAVSSFCNYPPEVKAKPKIGGMSNPSLEAIVAMKPDIVILTDDGNPREIEQRLRSLNIRTCVFPAKRLADLPREIRTLGKVLDVQSRADRSAGRIEKIMRQYGKKHRSFPAHALKKALFVVQPDPLMVAGPGTAIDDVLNLLGLQNIAADARIEYPHYSLEQVIRQSPDVIFIGKSHNDMQAQSRRLLKKLNQVEAVKKNRVYYIGDPLFRMGPRITAGIAEMAGYVDRTQK
jgi:iron complex transport system substrate-binding protein